MLNWAEKSVISIRHLQFSLLEIALWLQLISARYPPPNSPKRRYTVCLRAYSALEVLYERFFFFKKSEIYEKVFFS
jgi:hypothetical protein